MNGDKDRGLRVLGFLVLALMFYSGYVFATHGWLVGVVEFMKGMVLLFGGHYAGKEIGRVDCLHAKDILCNTVAKAVGSRVASRIIEIAGRNSTPEQREALASDSAKIVEQEIASLRKVVHDIGRDS